MRMSWPNDIKLYCQLGWWAHSSRFLKVKSQKFWTPEPLGRSNDRTVLGVWWRNIQEMGAYRIRKHLLGRRQPLRFLHHIRISKNTTRSTAMWKRLIWRRLHLSTMIWLWKFAWICWRMNSRVWLEGKLQLIVNPLDFRFFWWLSRMKGFNKIFDRKISNLRPVGKMTCRRLRRF